MTIALIPTRGGSKRILKKNIINFCGKPLLIWSLEQAKGSKKIDTVYVSTDDKEIASVATNCEVKVIWRPKEIAGDYATSEQALIHALTQIQKENSTQSIDYVVFLQATSPLRETEDIDNALNTIVSENADSLFSGARLSDFYIWKKNRNKLESVNYDYKNRGRGQEFGTQYVENGSIYVFKPEILLKYSNRLGGKITISLMDFWKSFEVDDKESLKLCEELFRLKLLKYYA